MKASAQSAGGRRPLVLVADDDDALRSLLCVMLSPRYDTREARDGREALRAAEQDPVPDLILLDVMMPLLDGYEVCRRLKRQAVTADIPVLFVTGKSDPQEETRGLLLGAVDFILKPVSAPRLLLRVSTQLALHDRRRELELMVAQRTAELSRARQQLIRRLARAMELRHGAPTQRVARVSQYVGLLAGACGLPARECAVLVEAAPLYDIGELGVSEAILRKADALTEREWTEMRRHPQIGAEIIGEHEDPLLAAARAMALTHHERWDGGGYPQRLAGEAIPLSGRIAALADAFEAMTTSHGHRRPRSLEDAAREIVAQSGAQFDPRVVAAFQAVARDFAEVHRTMADGPQPVPETV